MKLSICSLLLAGAISGRGEIAPLRDEVAGTRAGTRARAAGEEERFSSSEPSPPPVDGFLALWDTNDRTPPDTMGAVGLEHVVTALNTQMRIQTKSGEQVKTLSIDEFWAPLRAPHPFDPKIIYDPFADRFIAVACSDDQLQTSSLLVGVSHDGNPNGEWHLWKFENGDEGFFVDYPSLGFNAKWVAVQVMMKRTSDRGFGYSRIYVFGRQELYDGGEGKARIFQRDDLGMVQAPAVTLDPDQSTLYLISTPTEGGAIENTISLHAITGELGTEALEHVRTFEFSDGWRANPPGQGNFGPQRGTTNKLHFQPSWMNNVVYRHGSLWTTHVIFLPPEAPQRSAIQWFQFTPEKVLQRGRIEDAAGGKFYAYSSIAVNAPGDALIGFSRFSAEEHPSAFYSVRSHADPPGTFRPEHLLKSGEGIYYKTRGQVQNRWGDYSASVVDPADDLTFWTIQEYSRPPEGDPHEDGSGRWGTWWGKIPAPEPWAGLHFASIRQEGQEAVLQFRVPLGETARLERTSTLDGSSWVELETVEGNEGVLERSVSISGSVGFFRLRQ